MTMDLILVIQVVVLLLFMPAAMAWAAQSILRTRHPVSALLTIVVPAALPCLWLLNGAREADGITRAAGPMATLLMLLFTSTAAGLGFAQAWRRERT